MYPYIFANMWHLDMFSIRLHGKIYVSIDLCKNVVDIWSCLVSGHLSEGLLELLGDRLVLLLLGNKLILQPVHLQQISIDKEDVFC